MFGLATTPSSASSGSGAIRFIPDPDYFGSAQFTYTVTDGDTPVEATVTVNVTPVNDAPVASSR